MRAFSLRCPIHGIITSWPDDGARIDHHLTCWMSMMYDGTRCGQALALQVWDDPLTPDSIPDTVEQMERPDISKSSESSDPEVIRFLLERGDYHVMKRAIAALSSVSQCASCGSYERIVR